MGLKQSVFSQNELKLYQELSALDAAEINHAYRRFKSIDPLGGFQQDKKGGISFITVADNLKELKVNPFRYRLCKLFCAGSNGLMNFDDFLDLVSVLNDKCSKEKKVKWAFKLFDFNEDGVIDIEDINEALDMLTDGAMEESLKDEIAARVLLEADTDKDNAVSFEEFERIMYFSPDLTEKFRFNL